ncbi:hypothetical protein LCGC14_2813250 [marine sediment metagenome]|uniref:Helix-turn-helix domain-containing protein n=1 Tax=marine sediment metagenome TaxID=412755 RepID=A0A0F8YJ97_9ZZZZ
MSGLLMGRAFYFDLPPRQKLLLLAIADHANDDGYGCHPSQERLAEKVGCTRRHIHNLLQELIGQGLIEVIEQGNGAGLNTRYHLPWAHEKIHQNPEQINPERKGVACLGGLVVESAF